MARMTRIAMVLAGVMVMAVAAQADYGLDYGVKAGIYFPTSNKTRDIFGTNWWSLGFSPIAFGSGAWHSTIDTSVVSHSENGNSIFLATLGFGTTSSFGDKNARFKPYISAHTGPMYVDYSFTYGGNYTSDRRVSWEGSAEVGIVVQQTFSIGVRYDLTPRLSDVDFSGLSLQATLKLGHF